MFSTNTPYAPIAGNGLGLCYSSLTQVGELMPQQGMGQAKIKFYANMTNGNLVLLDHVTRVKQMNGELNLGYIYNSQATSASEAWHFLECKRFLNLPLDHSSHSLPPSVTLEEKDGHLTTYTFDPDTARYFAPGHADGTPFLYIDASKNWCLYHPGTQIEECFDNNGNLMSSTDLVGRKTTYEYDEAHRLMTIIDPGKNVYKIVRQNNVVEIQAIEDGKTITLQRHTFNEFSSLAKTEIFTDISKPYTIEYDYSGDGRYLVNVRQTDGTGIFFSYLVNNENNTHRLDYFQSEQRHCSITYVDQNQSGLAELKNGDHIVTQFALDDKGRLSKFIQKDGFPGAIEENNQDIVAYAYNDYGQIDSIMHADGSVESFTYKQGEANNVDRRFGLLETHRFPNDQEVKLSYIDSSSVFYLACRALCHKNDPKKILITRYVYEVNYDQTGKEYAFLRFKINPNGQVSEYRPDENGNIKSERVYLTATFDTSYLPPELPPDLNAMLEFSEKNKEHVSLIEYEHDTYGQILNICTYATVDKDGNGMPDAAMGHEQLLHDRFGNTIQREILQSNIDDNKIHAKTEKRFDALQRMLSCQDALNNKTTVEFNDQARQIKTTQPQNGDNALVVIKELDKLGVAIQLTEIGTTKDQTIIRRTSGIFSPEDWPVVVVQPDGKYHFVFYDTQQRLGFEVTDQGFVTEHRYDRHNRINTKIEYDKPITIKKMWPFHNGPPSVGLLIKYLKSTPGKDRCNYECSDASGRVIYKVDANLYLTEFIYDHLNRVCAEIRYATAISTAELDQLKNGQTLALAPDFSKDRCQQKFYYADTENLVGTQDAAGYINEYVRDDGGRIVEKIIYHTPTPVIITKDFSAIRPVKSIKDAHTTYILDGKNQRVKEIDPKGYLTERTFLSNGLVGQEICYYNAVSAAWLLHRQGEPPLPLTSTEDRKTIYKYDLLNREFERIEPFNGAVCTTYDNADNITQKLTKDLNDPENLDGSCTRATAARYNAWNLPIAEANPFVTQKLLNPDLSPEQIEEIWKTETTRHFYDDSGLKLYSIDPLNHKTLYYYDADRRPIIFIGPLGAVIEDTLDTFGNKFVTRAYKNRMETTEITKLTGGYITTELQNYLSQKLRDAKDHVVQMQHDSLGQVERVTDAENNISSTTYNAFRQQATETIPVADNQHTVTIEHQYEPRGLETKTIQTAGTLVVSKQFEYENPYGLQTTYIDPVGNRSEKIYDERGDVEQVINAASPPFTEHTYTRDAFRQIQTDTNALDAVTTHDYNQKNRTHTVHTPIKNVQLTITTNIFGQKSAETNTVQNNRTWDYVPDGQVSCFTDALGNKTQDQFDIVGRSKLHIDANKIEKKIIYTAESYVETKIEDAGKSGLKLTTTYETDVFGNKISIKDPRGVTTKQEFTLNNLPEKITIDPETEISDPTTTLNLITTNAYNAQATIISQTKVTTQIKDGLMIPSLYQETYQQDGLNRPIKKSIDPTGLAIDNQQQLNLNGKVIAEIDPNGYIKRHFYNSLNLERFVVDAEGGILELNYDAANNLCYKRIYENAINPDELTDQTTLTDLTRLVITDAQDTLLYYFYNENNNERYSVNGLGSVIEKRYDLADRLIETIFYEQQIDVSTLAILTTTQLEQIMENKKNDHDRHVYKILNTVNQDRYVIDAMGYIIENIFDDIGNIITTIQYATPLSHPASVAKLPVDQVSAKIKKNPDEDRTLHQVFDSLNRPWFTVDATGAITRFDHDDNGNAVKEIKFKNLAKPFTTYAELVMQLKAMQPDIGIDRITRKEYDHANRCIKEVDALSYEDEYTFDGLNNISVHTDRARQEWKSSFDASNRLTTETTPPIPITSTTSTITEKAAPAQQVGLLSAQMPGENTQTYFREKTIVGDGNCGFRALNVSRDDLANILLTCADDAAAREALQNEIYEALTDPDPLIKTNEANYLLTELENYWIIKNKIFNRFSALLNLSLLESITWLRDHQHLEEAADLESVEIGIQLTDDALHRYCQSKEAFEAYVNTYRNGKLWLGHESALLYAKAKHFSLYIWTESTSSENLELQKSHVLPQSTQPGVHLLHRDGSTHFNVLSAEPLSAGHYVQLSAQTNTIALEKKVTHDKAGNEVAVTDANNTTDARTLNCLYNRCNNPIETFVENIAIDDPSKPASWQSRPETLTAKLSTKLSYNAKQLAVTEKDESDDWHFTVYDSETRKIYAVHPLTASTYSVKKTNYNAFGEVVSETHYATPVALDITNYKKIGIPLQLLASLVKPDPSHDRTITMTRDHLGQVEKIEQDKVFCYAPTADGKPLTKLASPLTLQKYNAFSEIISSRQLIEEGNSVDENVFAETIYWRNGRGEILAEARLTSENCYVIKRYIFNSFGNNEEKIEYQQTLPTAAIKEKSLAELDEALAKIATPQDRRYIYGYDLRGDRISETLKDEVSSILQWTLQNPPVPATLSSTTSDLTRHYQLDALQQKIAITYEDNSTEYFYFDARGGHLGHADVARDNGAGITLIPYTAFYLNAFGECVQTLRFEHGVTHAEAGVLPLIINDPSAKDLLELSQFDKRGLLMWQQNPEGYVTGYTYTIAKKTARKWWQLTNNDAVHLDENRWTFNTSNKVLTSQLLRDNSVQQTTAITYNAFLEPIGEGNGDGTYPLFRQFDQLGNIWSTNEDGCSTILLYDLMRRNTVQLRSATIELADVTYTDIRTILGLGIDALERLETLRDYAGRVISKRMPDFNIPPDNNATNIPICLVSGNAYHEFGEASLTWVLPQERDLIMEFSICPIINGRESTLLNISVSNDRCGVDVSELPTDAYQYTINYYMRTNPLIHPDGRGDLVYTTTGKVQIDSGKIENSQGFVVVIEQDNIAYLKGKIAGITEIELWQNDQCIAKLPIENSPTPHVDLSAYASGIYTFKLENSMIETLQFAIYTATPSVKPLAHEITCEVKIETANDAAAVLWKIESEFVDHPIQLICKYVDDKDIPCVEITDALTPVKKADWNTASLTFEYIVKTITSLTVNMRLSKDNQPEEWIPLAIDLSPTSDRIEKEKETEYEKKTDNITTTFPQCDIVYITPLPGYTTSSHLRYLDMSKDRLAEWHDIPVMSVTKQGVVIEVRGLPPCIYPYQSDKKLVKSRFNEVILQGKIPGNEISFNFFEEIVELHPRCGFQLFSASREEVINELLSALIEDNKKLHGIAGEMVHQLLGNNFSLPTDIRWDKIKFTYDMLLQEKKHHLISSLHANAKKYCAQPHIIKLYFEALSENENNVWLGYETALLYAERKGISLYVWEKAEATNTLNLLVHHDSGDDSEQLHICHHSDFTRFSVLQDIAKPQLLEEPLYTFTVANDSMVYASEKKVATHLTTAPPPAYDFTYDVWNNTLTETNTLDKTISYTYNKRNSRNGMMQTEVTVVDEHGLSSRLSPLTNWAYNTRNWEVAEVDPNGNVSGQLLNAAKQSLHKIQGEGVGLLNQQYDALSRTTQYSDGGGRVWQLSYHFSEKPYMTRATSGKINLFTRNELGKIRQATNPDNHKTLYDYDVAENITRHVIPGGQQTLRQFDQHHHMTLQQNPDGTSSQWNFNFLGTQQWHIDLSGTTYKYWRDKKQQVIRQFSEMPSPGAHGSCMRVYGSLYDGLIYFRPQIFATPNQDLHFTHRIGNLVQVLDAANDRVTQYGLDSENERISSTLSTASNGVLISQRATEFDELRRPTRNTDSGMTVWTNFDAGSNRRVVSGVLTAPDGRPMPAGQHWYTYNKAKQVLINDGVMQGNIIDIGNEQGSRLSFGVDGLLKEQNHKEGGQNRSSVLGYDLDGLTTSMITNNYQREEYGLDGEGRRKTYVKTENGKQIEAETEIYDEPGNGWQTKAIVTKENRTTTTTYTNISNIGLPLHLVTQRDQHGYKDDVSLSYVKFDTMQLSNVQVKRKTRKGHGSSSSAQYHDSNGFIVAQHNIDNGNGGNKSVLMDWTYDGAVLLKKEIQQMKNRRAFFRVTKLIRNFHTNENDYLGSYELDIPRASQRSILNYSKWMLLNSFQHLQAMGIRDTGERNELLGITSQQARALSGFNHAMGRMASRPLGGKLTIDEMIAPAGKSFPPAVPAYYEVRKDDTFISIAENLYHSKDYAFLIAITNGYTSADDVPIPGAHLRTPQFYPYSNQAGQYRPYDEFMQQMMAALYPYVKIKLDDDGHFLGVLISIIVVAAVSYFSAGVLGPEMVGILLSSSATAAASAAGSAIIGATTAVTVTLASAAEQVVAVKAGWQDHFSLASAVENGVVAGLTAGMGSYMNGGAKVTELTMTQIGEEMTVAGGIDVTAQLTEMKLGLRHKFDFAQVGATMLAKAIALKANNAMNLPAHTFSTRMIQNVTSTAIQGALSKITGAPFDLRNTAIQLFGNAAGQEIGKYASDYFPQPTPVAATERKTSKTARVSEQGMYGNTSRLSSTNPSTSHNRTGTTAVANNYKAAQPTSVATTFSWDDVNQTLAESRDLLSGTPYAVVESNTLLVGYAAIHDNVDMTMGMMSSVPGASKLNAYFSLNTLTSTFFSKQEFSEEISSPKTWISSIADKISEHAKEVTPKYSTLYKTSWKKALDAHITMNNMEPTLRFSGAEELIKYNNLKFQATENFNLAAKYGLFSKGAQILRYAAPLAFAAEVIGAVYEIETAWRTENRTRVIFEQTNKTIFGAVGAFVGGLAGALEETIIAPIISTPIAIAGIAVGASTGSAIGVRMGDNEYALYEKAKQKYGY